MKKCINCKAVGNWFAPLNIDLCVPCLRSANNKLNWSKVSKKKRSELGRKAAKARWNKKA